MTFDPTRVPALVDACLLKKGTPLMTKLLTVPLLAATLLLSACGSNGPDDTDGRNGQQSSRAVAEADAAIASLAGRVFSRGPHGEKPAGFEATELTPEEVEQVRDGGFTAAIALHYGGNDWSTAQVAGLKQEFGRLGIEVVAVTDADFDPGQQVSNIETILAQKPDLLISLPTDPVATADAYQRAAASGVKIVFMDNVPQGMVAGEDYVSVVSADNKGAAMISGHQLAKSLNGEGKIGIVYHEADFFVTKQMHEGVLEALKAYPDIEVVEEKGIAGPDFAGDAQAVTNAMLTQHPDLAGMWGVWDVPTEGILAAARAAGRDDLVVTTLGLGANVATAMAKQELVTGLGAVRPFDLGIAEARLGAASLIGKTGLPAYVAVESLPVDHDNVIEAWQTVYQKPAPDDLRASVED